MIERIFAGNDENSVPDRVRDNLVKKTVYFILIFSLVIGFGLIIMDAMSGDGFNVPTRFEKVTVDLNAQFGTDVLIFSKKLDVPSTVEFFIQSDDAGMKNIRIVSESEILGLSSKEINHMVGRITGNACMASTLTLDKGGYSIYLTSEKASGKLVIGHQETEKEPSEFERLYKIHNGEANNPPEGYVEIYSTDLAGKSCKDEVIYTLTLDAAKNIGLSVYTSSRQGTVSVDFIGKNSSYYGMVHPELNRICDQMEVSLSPGEYQLKLTCENADGQLYVFMKQ